jgi:hypothetical protein
MFLPGPPNRAFWRTISQIVETVEARFVVIESEPRGEDLAHDRDLAKLAHPAWVPPVMQQFAGDVNGYTLLWRLEGQPQAVGSFDLYDLESTYNSSGRGVFYFEEWEDAQVARMKPFKAVDFFTSEACVGLYYDERADPELYFYDFEGEPAPLGIDIAGYLQLLTLSLGFYYWQLLVVELARPDSPRPYVPARDVHRNPDVLKFVDTMPQLYPAFSLEAFVALYDQVRLRR